MIMKLSSKTKGDIFHWSRFAWAGDFESREKSVARARQESTDVQYSSTSKRVRALYSRQKTLRTTDVRSIRAGRMTAMENGLKD